MCVIKPSAPLRMQRFAPSPRLRSVCICLLPPAVFEINTTKNLQALPLSFCRPSSSAPNQAPPRKSINLALSTLIKRTHVVEEVLKYFDTIAAWDDTETPIALSRLMVSFDCFVVSEVIRKCHQCDIIMAFFNWLNSRNDFSPDSYVYNALVHRLGKDDKFKDMEAVTSLAIREGKATLILFNIVLSAYRGVRDMSAVARVWNQMQELGFKPSVVTYTIMIDAFASLKMYEDASNCYLHLLKVGYWPSIRTCSTLIHYLVVEGKLDAASEIFQNLIKANVRPNAVTYTIIMAGHAKVGNVDAILRLIEEFKEYGHSPLYLGTSFTAVLQYLVREGKTHEAERILSAGLPNLSAKDRWQKIKDLQRQPWQGISCDDDMLRGEMGSITDIEGGDESEEYVDDVCNVKSGSAPSLNVNAFVKCISRWSLQTVKVLEGAHVQWNSFLALAVLIRMQNPNAAWRFYHWVANQPGYCHDRYTCAKILRLLSAAGRFGRVKQLLLEAHKGQLYVSLKTYRVILKCCGLRKSATFATDVFALLKQSGLKPDEDCYKCYIHSLYKCKRHWRVASLCSEMRKAGFPLDETLYSFLVTGFAGAGRLSIANRFYQKMRKAGFYPNVEMLSALIRSFCEGGRIHKAVKVYRRMREAGMVPLCQVCNLLVKVLSQLGHGKDACELKAVIQALPQDKKANDKRHTWYKHFHSVFDDSLKDKAKVETAMNAGKCMIVGYGAKL